MKEYGKFVVIEGCSGAGKTTQLNLMAEWLEKEGYDVLKTDEPTQGPIGNLIKEKFYHEKINPKIDALLFAADRYWHVEKVIKPALEKGKIVLSDRYYYSSLAIQSNQGISLDWIKELHESILKPDLVVLLDIPVKVALERAKEKLDHGKFTDLEFLKKVRETYKLLVYRLDEEIFVIDGTRKIDEIHERIRKITQQVLDLT